MHPLGGIVCQCANSCQQITQDVPVAIIDVISSIIMVWPIEIWLTGYVGGRGKRMYG